METSKPIAAIVVSGASAPIVSAQNKSAPAGPAMNLGMNKRVSRMQQTMKDGITSSDNRPNEAPETDAATNRLTCARREERDSIAQFGEKYVRYASKTPAFFPRLWSSKIEKATI